MHISRSQSIRGEHSQWSQSTRTYASISPVIGIYIIYLVIKNIRSDQNLSGMVTNIRGDQGWSQTTGVIRIYQEWSQILGVITISHEWLQISKLIRDDYKYHNLSGTITKLSLSFLVDLIVSKLGSILLACKLIIKCMSLCMSDL